MALDKELKSSITGIAATDAQGQNDHFASEPISTDADNMNPRRSEFHQTVAPEKEDVNSVLKRIEGQLALVVEAISKKDSDAKKDIYGALDRVEKQLTALTSLSEVKLEEKIKSLESIVSSVAEKQDRNDRQLAQDLRENANFRIQVRQGMQHDLDELKAQQSGEQFNPILKEIATVYAEYQVLLDEELPDRARKNLLALFEQLEDLLSDYDAEVIQSEVGSVRQTRLCKIINKIATPNSNLHNTIALSRKPGVVRGRTVLYQEFVDVYVYDSSMTENSRVETETFTQASHVSEADSDKLTSESMRAEPDNQQTKSSNEL